MAITEIIKGTLSLRKAAYKYNISASTLQHRIEKIRKNTNIQNDEARYKIYGSKYTISQVFTIKQEKMLSEYIVNCSKHALRINFDASENFGVPIRQTQM